MGYLFMSNIKNFGDINNENDAYVSVSTGEKIEFEEFIDGSPIKHSANFLMIRAHKNNDLLVQLSPTNYGVYIPATEMWSVDSLDKIDGIYVQKAFNNGSSIDSAKIQWMIGYK